MIDLDATKQRFKDSGRSYTGWGRSKGFDLASFATKMNGKVKFSEAEIAAMKADGLYVEKVQ